MESLKKKEFIQARRQRKKNKNYDKKEEKQIQEETEDEDLINVYTNPNLSTNSDSSDSDPLETQKEPKCNENENVQKVEILNTDYKLFKTSCHHLLRKEWNQSVPNTKLNVPPPIQIQVKSNWIEPKSIPRNKFESFDNIRPVENEPSHNKPRPSSRRNESPGIAPFPVLYPDFKYKFKCREGQGDFNNDNVGINVRNALQATQSLNQSQDESETSNTDEVENNSRPRQYKHQKTINALSKTGREEHAKDYPRLILDTSKLPFAVRHCTPEEISQEVDCTRHKSKLQKLKFYRKIELVPPQVFESQVVEFKIPGEETKTPFKKKNAWVTPPRSPRTNQDHENVEPVEAMNIDKNGSSNGNNEKETGMDFDLSSVLGIKPKTVVSDSELSGSGQSGVTSGNEIEIKKEFGVNVNERPHEAKVAVMDDDEAATQEEKATACKVKNSDEILELFSIKNVLGLEIRNVETENPASKYYSIGQINGLPKYTVNKTKVTENLDEFIKVPPPIGFLIQCTILRDRKGVDRGLFPTYFLHLEYEDGTKVFLLSARKRKKSKTSNYLICTDPIIITKDTMVGKLRSNLLGTQFNIFDNGQSPKSSTYDQINEYFREELGVVKYEYNILGFRGPRKLTFYIPAMLNEHQRFVHRPVEENGDSLIDNIKSDPIGSIIELKNKSPDWHEKNQSYVLNFHGRVSKASVKNFQLVHKAQEEYVILQFGRASDIDLDLFTLDFRFPLCPLQAMALAITSFDNKIACE